MDYIREFDIRLDREMYYAGEVLAGHVLLDTVENFKLRCKYNIPYTSVVSMCYVHVFPFYTATESRKYC